MRIDEDYAQRANPVSSIKAICEAYPLSIGLFRELLQNSDDAGASIQTLLLDRQTYSARTLYEEGLKAAQGPALFAFNDAVLQEQDWEGLRSMHDSSKNDDLSKIGKYGVGFRSVFNITDCPQILSNDLLAIFDPLCSHLSCEGKRIDLGRVWSNFGDTIAPFGYFTGAYCLGSSFKGTVIRCPLRSKASGLSNNIVAPDTIRDLLNDFIKQELEMCLLFLKNVKAIEIIDIDPSGNRSIIAKASVSRDLPGATVATHSQFFKVTLRTTIGASPTYTREWLLVHSDFPQTEVTAWFLQQPGFDTATVTNNLKDAKLRPEVGLALDITRLPNAALPETDGRLFTFLPLPITTGFPVHLHALFAIDSSRRYLKRAESSLLPGSRDHTVVQWNNLLFQEFIPRAWRILLETLTANFKSLLPNVFNIWPPEHPSGELRAYASSISQHLFDRVLAAKSAVWPVFSPDAQSALTISYKSLDEVVLARAATSTTTLKALTRAGLLLTHARPHISGLAEQALKTPDCKGLCILTPEVANERLQNCIQLINDCSDADKSNLIEYLLSTKKIENIIGLPLLPLGSSQIRIALSPSTSSGVRYTLMTHQEFDMFGSCDELAIPLHLLPITVSLIFRDTVSLSKINAQVLSVDLILSYLVQYPNQLGLTLSKTEKDPAASKWLSRFWSWFSGFAQKDELFRRMCGHGEGGGLWVLPSANGLRQLVMKPSKAGTQVPVPLFQFKGQNPLYTQPLLKLGLPFLDNDVDAQAGRVLESLGLCVTIQDVVLVLEALPEIPTVEPPSTQCDTILKFFSARLDDSVGEALLAKLKMLPIFPVMSFGSADSEDVEARVTTTWSPIPPGFSVRSISRKSKFVPTVDGILFVGLEGLAPELVSLIEAQGSLSKPQSLPASSSLSEHDLLDVTIRHLPSQPLRTQLALLSHVVASRQRIPPYIMSTIAETPFVQAEDGQLYQPGKMVDEGRAIGALYNIEGFDRDHKRFPRNDTVWHKNILACLKELALIQMDLTLEIFEERVQYIALHSVESQAAPPIHHLARQLLGVVCSATSTQGVKNTPLDFKRTTIDQKLCWLPTNRGLCRPGECRPGNGFNTIHSQSPTLFDRVLGLLDPPQDAQGAEKAALPGSLVALFGWDQPISTKVLIQQFDQVLYVSTNLQHDYPAYEAVMDILKELGHRASSSTITDGEYDDFRTLTADRKWIPTTSKTLEASTDVLFDVTAVSMNAGFMQIAWAGDEGVRMFLAHMGCVDHPLTKTIISKLHSLQSEVGSQDVSRVAANLLVALPPSISSLDRSKLLIPDTASHLRPFKNTLFNDIGDNHRLLPLTPSGSIDDNESRFIAHPYITEELARHLELGRLGLQFAELQDLGPSLGQDPITTVRQGLKDYTEQQFLLEFLANAEDAGATTFDIALNHPMPPTADSSGSPCKRKVISQRMEYLCELPSLVVHNDALFSKEDFEGICRTSVGGKRGRSDTIGEFGLGTLSMYHFADVITIISGDNVLFLDPSTKHLELSGSASIRIPLAHALFYQDHLTPADGLFGFHLTHKRYEGTLFILPLRSAESNSSGGMSPEFITPQFWDTGRLIADILQPFQDLAPDCLLFTNNVQTLQCSERRLGGPLHNLWELNTARHAMLEEPGFLVGSVDISGLDGLQSSWRTAKTTLIRDQVPEDLRALCLRRLPSAGLAARWDKASPPRDSYHFFSTLPLPMTTSLPMHIMASFQLSSDRRQIRTDFKNLQFDFNSWLLKDVIPPLYLRFMEYLRASGDSWYSQRWPTAEDDPISRMIVDGFYQDHMKTQPRRIFDSRYLPTQPLTSLDVVLSGDEPTNIHRVVELLRSPRLTEIPRAARKHAYNAGIAKVDAAFIREEIMRNPDPITSDPDTQVLADIIHYLTRDVESESANQLWELPILPLEDGSFGTLNPRSSGDIYYIWKPKESRVGHNFPRGRFVHPKVPSKDLKDLMRLELNVAELDATAIKVFIDQLSVDQELSGPWISLFWHSWSEYQRLGLKEIEVSSYPLVPTTQDDTFVSLDSCKQGNALLTKGDSVEDNQLRLCLQLLGLPVVRIDGEPTPRTLATILQSQEYPIVSFESALSALATTQHPIIDLFNNLDQDLVEIFAQWARPLVVQKPNDPLLALARELPIWPSGCRTLQRGLRSAIDIRLLPNGIPLEVAQPFMEEIVSDYQELQHLNSAPMTFPDIGAQLHLPLIMDEDTLASYKAFFVLWMAHLPQRYTGSVPVPTPAMTIKSSHELYARQPFFIAVFPPDSPNFAHPDFEEFEESLKACGLQQEDDLDADMFMRCVNELNPEGEGGLERARELFRAYSGILPRRVAPDDETTLSQFDDSAFIPRRMDQQRLLDHQDDDADGLVIPDDIMGMDPIVAPSELVREEFEAVAWSQKATFEAQPGRQILMAHATLGEPSFYEVFAHLRYLVSLHPTIIVPSQRRILLHDLDATYHFLNTKIGVLLQNAEFAVTTMTQLQTEPLFLNVMEPSRNTWRFDRADSLVFDTQDNEGTHPMRYVREFLLPFHDLLTAAGVPQIHRPQYTSQHDPTSVESTKLQMICAGFNNLRKQNKLTDIEFKFSTSATDGEPVVAHRSFLAVVSEFFMDMFSGDMKEAAAVEDGQLVPVEVTDHSRECVQVVLDFIYTGDLFIENSSLDLHLDVLSLSNYWDLPELFDRIQAAISLSYICPENLEIIGSAAKLHNAPSLAQVCEEYQELNQDYIRRVLGVNLSDSESVASGS